MAKQNCNLGKRMIKGKKMEFKNPYWQEEKLEATLMLPLNDSTTEKFLDFVCAHAWDVGFEEKRIEDIRVALGEVLKSIRIKSYEGREGEVRVECNNLDGNILTITVIDYGRPFNLLISDISFDEEDRMDISARKVKKLIKNVEYRRDRERNLIIFSLCRSLK